jgi:hypothetical protein
MNARSKNRGFISFMSVRVFSLMVKKRMTMRISSEKPTEMNNHFRCDVSMPVHALKNPHRESFVSRNYCA